MTDTLLARQRNYLGYENHRNTVHAQLYTDVINTAFGPQDVIVGHHLTFEQHGNIKTENEVPSADTLLFDTEVARRVFGDADWRNVLQRLAITGCEHREAYYAHEFYTRHPHLKVRAA
jgi:hypothetical protein